MIPVARTTGLLSEPFDGGLVVYDRSDHRTHSLNAVSAFVWLASDGINTVEEIALQLGRKLGREADGTEMRALVLMALGQLKASGLLEREVYHAVEGGVAEAVSRRAAAATIGKAALLLGGVLPSVFSLVSPDAASAQTLGVTGSCTVTAGGTCLKNTCTGTCRKDAEGLLCDCI